MRLTKVEIMRETVRKVVAILAARRIEVIQRGNKAYVVFDRKGQPIQVVLPNIPDDASDELIAAVQGFLDHEVAHILFTDTSVAAKADHSAAKSMFAMLEDIHIERRMRREFTGSFRNLESTWRFVQDRVLQPEYDKAVATEANGKHFQALLFMAAIRAWNNEKPAVEFMADKWKHFDQLKTVLGDDLISEIPKINSTLDAYKLSVAMQNRIEEYKREQEEEEKRRKEEEKRKSAPPPPSTPPSPSSSSESGDEDEDDEGDEESEMSGSGRAPSDKDDDETTDEEDDTDGDEEDDRESDTEDSTDESEGDEDDSAGESKASGDDEEDDEDSGTGDHEDDFEEDDSLEGEDEDEGAGGEDDDESGETDDEGDSTAGDDDDEPYNSDSGGTENDDEMEEPRELEPLDFDPKDAKDLNSLMNSIIEKTFKEDYKDTDYYPFSRELDVVERFVPQDSPGLSQAVVRLDEEVLHMTGKVQKHLERAIAAHSLSRQVPGFKTGKIHAPSLHRVATGSDKLFSRKHVTTTKDTAVQLVVDLSGSMSGTKVKLAMETGYALSSVLDRMNIANEVIGFTTCPWRDGTKFAELQRRCHEFESTMGRSVSRVEPLYIPILKSFGERLTIDRKKAIVGVISQTRLYNNVDGESILVCAKRLASQPQARKIMIVLSDGSPQGGYGDYNRLQWHLKKVVKDLPSMGIEPFGIGIMDDSVREFYPKHEVISELEELPSKVIKTMERMLFN